MSEIRSVKVIPIPGTNYKAVERTFLRIGFELVKHDEIQAAQLLVIPGVSTVKFSMEYIEKSGWVKKIRKHHENLGQILGICSGMQLLFEGSEEHNATGLGLIDGHISAIESENLLPTNIGWHSCSNGSVYYFMHSYCYVLNSERSNFKDLLAINDDLRIFAFGRVENIILCQFHPEKSGRNGLDFLKEILH